MGKKQSVGIAATMTEGGGKKDSCGQEGGDCHGGAES